MRIPGALRPPPRVLLALVATFAAGGATRAQQAASPFAGYWVGGIEAQGQWQFATVTLRAGGSVTGRLALPLDGFARDFTSVQIDGRELHGELRDAGIAITGRLTGDEIEGAVQAGGRAGRLTLARAAELPPESLAIYTGAYRFTDGRELVIDALPDIPNALLVTDVRTGQVRAFFPGDEGRFFAGPALLVPLPTEQTLAFDRVGGVVTAVRRARGSARAERARRVPVRREEVRIASGAVTLAGTLLLPPGGARRVPAVVFTHGGGPALREWFWGLGYLFAARGIAVLAYDKRGAGASTGSWRDASFDDLAGDAVAAAGYLRSRRDIRPGAIGFWGISQGGWIAPLAATRFSDAAFAIALSGGGISPAGQELLDTRFELGAAGLSPDLVDEALRFQRLRNEYALHGTGWSEYQAAVQRAQHRPWFRFRGTDTWGPATQDDPYWARVRRFYFYDPAPTLRSLRAPLLALFGGMDSPPSAQVNADSLRRVLTAAGNGDFTIRVIPLGRHNLMEVPADAPLEFARLHRFPPGLLAEMVDWVRARVQPRRAGR